MTDILMTLGRKYLTHIAKDRSILEVGSYNVNGSFRSFLDCAGSYIGVDITPGPGVDQICNIHDLVSSFGENSFDMVICTEVLEHVEDVLGAINQLKMVSKDYVVITVPSTGFPRHNYPSDFWRLTRKDFEYLFSDMVFSIDEVIYDQSMQGIFMVAFKSKLKSFVMKDISLYDKIAKVV
jgi:predicted SAM-dependent methyltransferase